MYLHPEVYKQEEETVKALIPDLYKGEVFIKADSSSIYIYHINFLNVFFCIALENIPFLF